jgi:hypothetical protein
VVGSPLIRRMNGFPRRKKGPGSPVHRPFLSLPLALRRFHDLLLSAEPRPALFAAILWNRR